MRVFDEIENQHVPNSVSYSIGHNCSDQGGAGAALSCSYHGIQRLNGSVAQGNNPSDGDYIHAHILNSALAEFDSNCSGNT